MDAAIKDRQFDVIRKIIETNLDKVTHSHILCAAAYSDLEMVRFLFGFYPPSHHAHVFIAAAYNNSLEAVQALNTIEVTQDTKRSALEQAIRGNSFEVVRYLVGQITDKQVGYHSMRVIATTKNFTALQIFRDEFNIDISLIFDFAVCSRDLELIRYMISGGFRPANISVLNPLHITINDDLIVQTVTEYFTLSELEDYKDSQERRGLLGQEGVYLLSKIIEARKLCGLRTKVALRE